MIFSNKSEYRLKYQKAKAKLEEYNVPLENYPNFLLNSNELSYSTIYMLSRYAESIIENDIDTKEEYKYFLEITSQYFDASFNSHDRSQYNIDFLLSGAASYFLANEFGSAKVICSNITKKEVPQNTPQLIIKELLDYLLCGKGISVLIKESLYNSVRSVVFNYFKHGNNVEQILPCLNDYRKFIYNTDNPVNIYYVDILIAIINVALEKSSWKLLPYYSELDLNLWSDYISKKASIKMLWPSQQLIAQYDILRGKNAIIQLPTGVGKTKSIELIIRSAFLSKRATTAIIIAPLRALCNEITYEMRNAFDNDVLINQFSDVLQDDFSLNLSELYKAKIIICTPEKLSYIIRHQPDILDVIDLFVFDEGHMFDDGQRGVGYELLVSDIRSKITTEQQLILMSAVLSNSENIKNWLFENNGVLATDSIIKATPKSIGFTSASKDISYYTDNKDESDFYIPRSLTVTSLNRIGKETKQRYFPDISKSSDLAIYYANKLCPNGGVAIYSNSTNTVKTILKRITDIHKRGYDLSNIIGSTSEFQIKKINKLISDYYGESHTYTIASRIGVFPHSSKIPNGVRVSVEYAYKQNHIRFVVCTSTLAQGVNIPIKYLFITNLLINRKMIQARNFQNLIGRTARSGIYTEGSIIITDPRIFDQKDNWKNGGVYRWADCFRLFDSNNSEPCSSSILSLVQDVINDYESGIAGINIAKHIIENYKNDDCFDSLEKRCVNWFKRNYPNKPLEFIHFNIISKKLIIDAIENHLCFIFAQEENIDKIITAESICKETLAYTLASDEEKLLLIDIFKVIAEKLINYPTAKLHSFARSMVGIDLSLMIEKWLDDKDITRYFYTEEQLTDMLLCFFKETHNIQKLKESFDDICILWLNGKMPIEIHNETHESIDDIDDICNKLISYEFSFFVGNIIDMLPIEESDEETINPYDTLILLQNKIKYGV